MEDYIKTIIGKVATEILNILLLDPRLPMSWGMSNPKPIYSESLEAPGLQIHVQGYKYIGDFQIFLIDSRNSFTLRWGNEGSENLREDVLLPDLANTIDEIVEKTEDYEERIAKDYPNLTKIADSDNPLNIVIL